ncbi:hypothetical protein [Longimicrobium sp.]|uniref:hypothetical protein n=1 Tax=Longimicrobium sp. TaxID=2029185 RepID=UPI002E30A04E|nr:hypothetical protein [Longimicrobium sp.]HEX6037544.1 hypothetical protein [Longimicrobium sp.]
MIDTLRRTRRLLFGLTIAASLGFGAQQALAEPVAARSDCDGEGQVYMGTCPASRDCGYLCASGVGACFGGCCNCRF